MKNFLQKIFNVSSTKVLSEDDVIAGVLEGAEPKHAPKFVEIDEEEIQPVVSLYNKLHGQQMRMGQIALSYEREKKEVLGTIEEIRVEIEEKIDELRDFFELPEEDEYILNLPTSKNPKGAFIKGSSESDMPHNLETQEEPKSE